MYGFVLFGYLLEFVLPYIEAGVEVVLLPHEQELLVDPRSQRP